MKKQKVKNDFQDMQKLLKKRQKWDDFRERKRQGIEAFINVKRRQFFIKLLIKLIHIKAATNALGSHVTWKNERIAIHNREVMLNFKMKMY